MTPTAAIGEIGAHIAKANLATVIIKGQRYVFIGNGLRKYFVTNGGMPAFEAPSK